MATRYAANTKVPVERSKVELETLLRKHGATGIVTRWDATVYRSVLIFELKHRTIRYEVAEPLLAEMDKTSKGRKRTPSATRKACDQEHRRRWRALYLYIRAKLEWIAAEESTVEREFLADIMLPDGETFGAWAGPHIEKAYAGGDMPQMLQLPGGKR